jgi:hypothetical protein
MSGNLFNMINIFITAYILSCFKEVALFFLSRTQVILLPGRGDCLVFEEKKQGKFGRYAMRIFCRQMVRTAWDGYNDFENREYKHFAVAERGEAQIAQECLPIIEPKL